MKYNGIELKEITEPQICNPPKKMLVWSSVYNEPLIAEVSAVVCREDGLVAMCYNGECFPCCADIPEKQNPRRATNRELARWISYGNGEVKDTIDVVISFSTYHNGLENNEVPNGIKVRKWDEADWHEPTIDYLGLE